MEKVKLTVEQNMEMQSFRSLGRSLEDWIRDRDNENYPNSVLHTLTIDEMARAIYTGYDVEPEKPKFKKGDLVFVDWDEGGDFQTVAGADEKGVTIYATESVTNTWPRIDIVRHATKEEEWWIRTLGREKVGDFREGDVFVDEKTEALIIGEGNWSNARMDSVKRWYKEGDFKGIYPAESFKPFPGASEN